MFAAKCKTADGRPAASAGVAEKGPGPGAVFVETGGDEYACPTGRIRQRDISRRVSARQLCRLARQLATLLRAGLGLVPALSALLEQLRQDSGHKMFSLRSSNKALAKIMQQVVHDVNAGRTFSGALAKHGDVFSPVFVNMIAAGEAGGRLEEVLLGLARMLEKRVHLLGKVKSAIAYPVMIIVVAVAVVVFLLSFVVPGITGIFIEMNRALPWPTRLLIWASAFIRSYLLPSCIGVCAAVFGIGLWLRSKEARLVWDRSKLRVPLFGQMLLKLETARLSRTLGTLIASGISIVAALEIVKRVVKNSFIADALNSVKQRVSSGDDLAGAVRKTGLFPPIVFHIIAVGQIGSGLDEGLLNIADMYDDEVEMTTKTLLSLLEPAILLITGLVVGFIVLAVLLPIFEINQVL